MNNDILNNPMNYMNAGTAVGMTKHSPYATATAMANEIQHDAELIGQANKNNFSGFPNIDMAEKAKLMTITSKRQNFINGLTQSLEKKKKQLAAIKSSEQYMNATGNELKAQLEDLHRLRDRAMADLADAVSDLDTQEALLKSKKNLLSRLKIVPTKSHQEYVALTNSVNAKKKYVTDLGLKIKTYNNQISDKDKELKGILGKDDYDRSQQEIMDRLAREAKTRADDVHAKNTAAKKAIQDEIKRKADEEAATLKALQDANNPTPADEPPLILSGKQSLGPEKYGSEAPASGKPQTDPTAKKSLIKGVPNKVLWISGVSLTVFTGIVVYYKFFRKAT